MLPTTKLKEGQFSQKVYSKSAYIFLFYKSDYPVILSLLRDGV